MKDTCSVVVRKAITCRTNSPTLDYIILVVQDRDALSLTLVNSHRDVTDTSESEE